MADDAGRVQATVSEETKTLVSVDVGGVVSDLSQVIPSYRPGEYRIDPPKALESGRTYVLTLLDDGRALLRLPWGAPTVRTIDFLADAETGSQSIGDDTGLPAS